MKKTAFVITLLLGISQVSYAQPLTADELLEMVQCNEYKCISEEIEPKGYEIALNKETSGYKTYTFNSKTTYQNESNPTIAQPYKAEYNVRMDDRSVSIDYTVGNKSERELLLAGFQHQGFEYVRATKTESIYDNSATVYTSKLFPHVTLKVTDYEKKDHKITYLDYDFELMRKVQDSVKTEKKDNPLQIH